MRKPVLKSTFVIQDSWAREGHCDCGRPICLRSTDLDPQVVDRAVRLLNRDMRICEPVRIRVVHSQISGNLQEFQAATSGHAERSRAGNRQSLRSTQSGLFHGPRSVHGSGRLCWAITNTTQEADSRVRRLPFVLDLAQS